MANNGLSAAALILAAGHSGGGSGTTDYTALSNKPQIESVSLVGNKTAADLGLQKTLTAGDAIDITNNEIDVKYGSGLWINPDNNNSLELNNGNGIIFNQEGEAVILPDAFIDHSTITTNNGQIALNIPTSDSIVYHEEPSNMHDLSAYGETWVTISQNQYNISEGSTSLVTGWFDAQGSGQQIPNMCNLNFQDNGQGSYVAQFPDPWPLKKIKYVFVPDGQEPRGIYVQLKAACPAPQGNYDFTQTKFFTLNKLGSGKLIAFGGYVLPLDGTVTTYNTEEGVKVGFNYDGVTLDENQSHEIYVTNPVPSYNQGDANKVLAVNAEGTGTEWANAGGGSSYTFTNGLTESSGTVSWNLNDRIAAGNSTALKIGNNINKMNCAGAGNVIMGHASAYSYNPLQISGGSGNLVNGYGGSDCSIQTAMLNGYYPNGAHAEGYAAYDWAIQANANGAHAEGYADKSGSSGTGSLSANGKGSHAEGYCTQAISNYQHAAGKFNVADSSGTGTYAYIIGNGTDTNARSNAFTVDWSGNVVAAGTVTPTGADYCEYFEFEDGNPEDEDRMGMLVTLKQGKIVFANESDDILGITTGTKGVIGDAEEMNWSGKYVKDELGRYVYEDYDVVHEEGTENEWVEHIHTKKVSPDFDPTQTYIPRSQRQEWYPVGLLGKIYVKYSGQLAADDYITANDGIAIKSNVNTNIKVLEIVNDHIARVLLK